MFCLLVKLIALYDCNVTKTNFLCKFKCHRRLDMLVSLYKTSRPPSSKKLAFRPQRPYGLLGTESPGRPPLPLHSSRAKSLLILLLEIKVPGEIKRSRDLEEGRWSWTLKLAQKRSWVGRWSWVAKVGLLSLRVVRQQQFNGHCPCDSVQARQLKQQMRSAQVAGQWRGDTALTLPLFWRRSTVSPVFGLYPRSSLHSFLPFPLCPPP